MGLFARLAATAAAGEAAGLHSAGEGLHSTAAGLHAAAAGMLVRLVLGPASACRAAAGDAAIARGPLLGGRGMIGLSLGGVVTLGVQREVEARAASPLRPTSGGPLDGRRWACGACA